MGLGVRLCSRTSGLNADSLSAFKPVLSAFLFPWPSSYVSRQFFLTTRGLELTHISGCSTHKFQQTG